MRCPVAFGLIAAIVGCSPGKPTQEREQSIHPAKVEEASTDRLFNEAIADLSTNTSFVLVTITDTKTGTKKTGCTSANGLLGAIHREHNIGYDEASMRTVHTIALAPPRHHFAFTESDALKNVGFDKLDVQYPEECALLREGWTATRGDIGYMLFTDKPGYQPNAGQGSN